MLLTACVILLCSAYLIVRHLNTLAVPPITQEEFAEFSAAIQNLPQEQLQAA